MESRVDFATLGLVANNKDTRYADRQSFVSVGDILENIPNFTTDEQLLPVVAQDAASGEVLMLAYMNRAAWEATLATGEAVYYSRSRGRLWKKGESSGHVQYVREVYVDCDADTILLKVEQSGGAACHQGYTSCFYRQRKDDRWQIVGKQVFNPKQVYQDKDPSA